MNVATNAKNEMIEPELIGESIENYGPESREKKTYIVFQDKYNKYYGVTDVEDFNEDNPDIMEYFEAEDGAEWYGTVVESLRLRADDIDDFDLDDIKCMCDEQLMSVFRDYLPEEDFYDFEENGAGITECEEDYIPSYNKGYERDVDHEGVSITAEIKFKFILDGGEVKSEIVW